jgi:hypothetical protein
MRCFPQEDTASTPGHLIYSTSCNNLFLFYWFPLRRYLHQRQHSNRLQGVLTGQEVRKHWQRSGGGINYWSLEELGSPLQANAEIRRSQITQRPLPCKFFLRPHSSIRLPRGAYCLTVRVSCKAKLILTSEYE